MRNIIVLVIALVFPFLVFATVNQGGDTSISSNPSRALRRTSSSPASFTKSSLTSELSSSRGESLYLALHNTHINKDQRPPGAWGYRKVKSMGKNQKMLELPSENQQKWIQLKKQVEEFATHGRNRAAGGLTFLKQNPDTADMDTLKAFEFTAEESYKYIKKDLEKWETVARDILRLSRDPKIDKEVESKKKDVSTIIRDLKEMREQVQQFLNKVTRRLSPLVNSRNRPRSPVQPRIEDDWVDLSKKSSSQSSPRANSLKRSSSSGSSASDNSWDLV